MVAFTLLAAVAALQLATGAEALLSLPYKKCDTGSGCQTRSTSIIMDGPRQDYSALQVFQSGSDGLLLTAPLSRSYVVDPSGSKYEMFYLKNRQISIDIDISKVQCGYNAAFYFSSMNKNAAIGTGYCDAQGTNCNEMDNFEGNYGSVASTMHSCSFNTGTCDPWGCGINSYNNKLQIGPGLTIDTRQKFTLTTKFYTNTGTDSGTLNKIEFVYSQSGRSVTTMQLTEDNCKSGKYWTVSEGMPALSKALDNGQVMIFSFWGTGGDSMSWLDGGANANPRCKEVSTGTNRVTFNNIVVDYLNGARPPTSSTPPKTTTTSRPTGSPATSPPPSGGGGNCSAKYGQCGGSGWSGPTCCASGSVCTKSNDWYSQCL
ncbi:concanavalin A-like lectin/glucanase domain-containing protein [Cladochytrium replicatum]|nr:concanavalin A-like lectin/glucanase domain-containing protein [Cladochytrium replicatum]